MTSQTYVVLDDEETFTPVESALLLSLDEHHPDRTSEEQNQVEEALDQLNGKLFKRLIHAEKSIPGVHVNPLPAPPEPIPASIQKRALSLLKKRLARLNTFVGIINLPRQEIPIWPLVEEIYLLQEALWLLDPAGVARALAFREGARVKGTLGLCHEPACDKPVDAPSVACAHHSKEVLDA